MEREKLIQRILFERASVAYKEVVLKWLNEPHIKEFWDNSPEHGDDIIIFMNGRKKPSPYYGGMFSYWIGKINSNPFALIMTSVVEDIPTLKDSWRQQLSKTGTTYSIDFCIGNVEFLGRGLAASTLKAFVDYFQNNVDEKADTFIIDPNENNPRAKHVYEKAGFKTISKFKRRDEVFYLMVMSLANVGSKSKVNQQ